MRKRSSTTHGVNTTKAGPVQNITSQESNGTYKERKSCDRSQQSYEIKSCDNCLAYIRVHGIVVEIRDGASRVGEE